MTEAKAEAPMGFPGDCPTNAYVLEGFSHVVYMVSTAVGSNTDTKTPIVSRLRNAEKELRSQSPLVSLDLVTNELYTFHRLIDFQKDGKSIYGRLAMVLRQNNCMNSFKSVLRATDLLKEEHTRLRSILLAAIFSAVKSGLLNDSAFIPLGMRSFLRTPMSNDAQFWNNPAESVRGAWQIDMVDLQLLPHGQLLIINVSRKPEHFRAISDILEGMPAEESNVNLNPGMLCLAPTGQMARYTDGQVITSSAPGLEFSRPGTAQSELQSSHLQDARRRCWMEQLVIWLADQGIRETYLNEKNWVEVEILMSRHAGQEAVDNSRMKDGNLVWKRVLWPAPLCFYTQHPQTRPAIAPRVPSEDPIAFVQDWLLKSDERAREMARVASTNTNNVGWQETQTVDNLDEDSGFGSTPRMHIAFSAGLPPSQMMYPTPPDISYTQATPGMSSVDGIVMTPADTTRPALAAVEQQNNIDMLDHMDTSGVGTGTYDEDLFEDLPTHRFGTTGATDEPDWDFFEQHNGETCNDRPHSDEIENGTHLGPDKAEEDRDPSAAPAGSVEESMLPPQLHERASAQPLISSPSHDPKEASLTQTDHGAPAKTTQEDFERLAPIDMPSEEFTSPQVEAKLQPLEPPSEIEIWKKPALPSGRGRRRSLYDSSEDLTGADDHDERYTANGAFWFDAISKDRSNNGNKEDINDNREDADDFPRAVSSHRTSSDGSPRSEASSFYEVDDMDLDKEDSNGLKRKWTEYEQDATAFQLGPTTEELNEIHTDTRNLLELLRPMNLDQTWILGNDTTATSSVQDPAVRPNHGAMVAQILVDQLAQTCLPRDDELRLQSSEASEGLPDNSKILDSPYGKLEPATFTSLTKAHESASQNDGSRRLQSLDRYQLCLSRTDKNLLVSSTALSLWENLNFQPKGGRKDVQGFFIHPTSANLEAGCGKFLERVGETYVSCNLGDHSIGQIAGTSNNGLVSWSDEDDTIPNLEQCCERLGTALARLPPVSDNIVIYMIMIPGSDLSPLAIVEAFCVLFDAYLKACNKQHSVELGLQIVPSDFVVSPDTLVVRSSQEYLSLAIEVYNRFPPTKAEEMRAYCGSAVVLAETPRRRIRFDMAGQNGTFSEIGAPCLHVSMCYPIKTVGRSKPRPRIEIIRDIWEVSLDLMAKEQHLWRLVVARDGFSTCSPVLVSVDLNPALVPQTPAMQSKPTQAATPQQLLPNYGTPVSTPQASTTSPDQYLTATPTPSGSAPLNAATPPEVAFDPNNEADLTVQDPTEESWSVVLPFGLNQSREVIKFRSAMLSGYLLKRQGMRGEDGLAKLGVNLIHTSTLSCPPDADDAKRKALAAAREDLLKEILGQYRGLVTLARTRGGIDAVHNVVPWHVATAIKGARILNKWM